MTIFACQTLLLAPANGLQYQSHIAHENRVKILQREINAKFMRPARASCNMNPWQAHGNIIRIRAGRVVINNMTDDPQAPWGGFKYSGVGREYGRYGIGVFVETRAILE